MNKKVMMAGAMLAATTLMTVTPLTDAPVANRLISSAMASAKYNDSEYALMGYLMLDKDAKIAEIAKEKPAKDGIGMTLTQKGNTYTIGFGGHTTDMIVNADSVTVSYDDFKSDGTGMGDKNASKTYSKSALAAKYGDDKPYFDRIIKNFNLSTGTGQASQQPAKNSTGSKLEYNSITPMETAAAIVYYQQPRMFKDSVKNGGMELRQRDSSDVDEPGNGIMFELVTKNAQEGSFDYTVDHDGEIYFYGAGDHHHGSVNLHKVINKVNNDGAVAKVRALATEIDFVH